MNYYYLFGVFLSQYDFQVSFNLKVILYMAKITQNTVTELLYGNREDKYENATRP